MQNIENIATYIKRMDALKMFNASKMNLAYSAFMVQIKYYPYNNNAGTNYKCTVCIYVF